MLGRIISAIILVSSSSAGLAQTLEPNGNRNLHVAVDFNFITEASNHWVSDGIFVDQGTIKHDHSEFFRGSVAKVTDSPAGQNGTFTWSFSKAYSGSGANGQYAANGAWKMLGGTGKYEGISGEGILTGTLNAITGQIHDEFIGKVSCPKC